MYLHKNSQTVKKGVAHEEKQHEKVVKSKIAAQKWLWWSDNGKIFDNGKFLLPIQKCTSVIVIKIFSINRLPQLLLGRHL